ncbi:monovalent cation/H(+) antiporter subunit G [Streptacidiphilus griseoplanus]|uniref:monovalent cation/H(+) antiporter subunit G n=1 Tax=Peterkaempfera griseoplana TaxID=66896 RepID=UPI0006E17321|nr:monovalent cation/H(+) antiporter subunit G [Peterkaempfera griseoplana]
MPEHIVVLVLLWAGTGLVLLSAVSLALLPDRFQRLHALAPAAGLGVPLIALAVAVDQGVGRAALKTLLIGALLAVGGTVGTMAVGKATLEAEGRDRR